MDMEYSLSMYQRFSFLFNFEFKDYIYGIAETKIPNVGIHNGLHYIIAISGIGGILYLLSTFRWIYKLSKPILPFGFTLILFIAIIMQNGAVFAPSKVVLFSLILLPLTCRRIIKV
tara:strand:+ start:25 stop:372 length:348 start_codon:yes stop_codon:yes gene_type:complete